MQTRKEFIELFIKGIGCFSVAASLPFVPSSASASRASLARREIRFPQGLASGDPTTDSVVLWTRAVDSSGDTSPIQVMAQVSTSPDFSEIIAEKECEATTESDFTVRLIVHDLKPDTRYHYRFVSGGHQTPLTGRTRTAPAPDSGKTINIAYASCQSYEGGFYHAYRELIERDKRAESDDQIDLVLHLGDFIYETLGYGSARKLPPFPSGGGDLGGSVDWARSFAVTLEDYRHLYRHYLMDPDLMEARARWPFVVTWDDHEFTDDSWQGVATYTTPNTPSQSRKLAANRAWFEYIPAFLTGLAETTKREQHASDFKDAVVTDAPITDFDEHGFSNEPNNRKAIESLTIYRSFRWGRHVDLLVTDTRSYRSRHPVPGAIALEISGNARYVAPLELVKISDAGRTWNGGNPPDVIEIGGQQIPNQRKNDPVGTLLGARQKEWFKKTLAESGATWKVCASSVPMMPMRMDLHQVNPEATNTIFTTDTWEGYLSEREELMNFLKDNRIRNFISLAGDNHNSFAGILSPDFENMEPEIVGAEFSVCGISSTSVFSALVGIVENDNPLRPLITYDGSLHGGDDKYVQNLNTTFLWGSKAAAAAAQTGSVETALQQRNPMQNPHLRYVDSNAYGIGIVRIDGRSVRNEFITIAPPVDSSNSGVVLRNSHLEFPAFDTSRNQDLIITRIDGQKPFPLSGLG
ncbi:MAG: hypothetical protein EA364_12480 [Balneolaceae bacterium]|nr:MAG: hypothetical protein EA364_12480 [Balneolaceae bacterium]